MINQAVEDRICTKIVHQSQFAVKLTGNSIQKVSEFGDVGRNGLNAPATFYLQNKRPIVSRSSC